MINLVSISNNKITVEIGENTYNKYKYNLFSNFIIGDG